MSPEDFGEHLVEFYDHAVAGRTRQGVHQAVDMLDTGTSHARIIADLLAASQRHVGDEWQRNVISVADEHLATGVTESALYALASAESDGATIGRVVVACPVGDWHPIASHMFSEQLRSAGLDVTFLGAATPGSEVALFLRRRRPDALIVTCNLPIFFPGVVALADVAHEVGIPVLVGGRALGHAPQRTRRLGSDGPSGNLDEVLSTLSSWRQNPAEVSSEPDHLDPLVASTLRASRWGRRRTRGSRRPSRPWLTTRLTRRIARSGTYASSSSSWRRRSTSTIRRSSPSS